MSDKLKELTPVSVTFAGGESPTPNKLESAFTQLSNAMDIIERAVGDVWNQSSETSGPLYADPNYVTNIARALGNMSTLNPSSLGGNELTVAAEAVPEGKKVFTLDNVPDNPATPGAVTFTNSTGVFDALVATKALVDGAGDYFIKSNGMVFTFTDTGATHTVGYDYTTVADSYTGATYNVIPDPSQTGSRCTVIVSGSGRQITLPTVTDSGSLNYTQQLTLPEELDSLADAEEIPAGYMYVWDHVGDGGSQRANSIVEGLTFIKIGGPGSSLATFYAEGVDLAISASEPNRYSVICPGAKTTSVIKFLRDYVASHTHNDNISQFLEHSDLLGSDDAITHGTSSDIVGKDDAVTLTNKILVDPVLYDSGGAPNVMIRALDNGIRFLNASDTATYRELHLNSIPDALTGKAAQYVIDALDGITEIAARSTPLANSLLPLDGTGKFPASVLPTGSGGGFDADTVDGKHVSGANGAGEITTNNGSQTLTSKTLTSPDINGGTVDNITHLTLADNVDVGSYYIKAIRFISDATTGTVPLYVDSTTLCPNLNADRVDNYDAGNSAGQVAVSNGTLCSTLNADKLNSQSGSYYRTASNLNAGTLPAARFNNTSHGNRTGTSSHQAASGSTNGFMTSTQYTNMIDLTDSGTTTLHSHTGASGSVVQVVNVQDGAVSTGVTLIPADDSIPQKTEGNQFMTLAITPAASANKLKIEVVCHLAGNNSDASIGAFLLQNDLAPALASGFAAKSNAANTPGVVIFTHYMTAGTTSSITFRVRGGLHNVGTCTFNGVGGARKMGGSMSSSITITEIKA